MTELLSEVLTSDVDISIHRNNHKLTADKIISILDTVRDEASRSRRRWIWELMQNAKDVPNTFKQVNIQVELTENELRFAHNGNPFSIDNLTGLIQQVSSKPSDSSDENTTGKFGTGFITTHLLSDIIHVKGVVARPEGRYKRFNIVLDRSGKTSEELLPSIEKALNQIRSLDVNSDFPYVDNFELLRKVEDLDSEFIYPLKDETSKTAAQAGLNDLIYTLPITMINIQKIGSVKVLNRVENSEIIYSFKKVTDEENLKSYEVNITTKGQDPVVKRFYVWEEEDVKLVCEVTNWKDFELIDNIKKQPFLYRDFPLIGTENFHFPFVLNGMTFYPTPKRDSILINENTEKSIHNRNLIEQAVKSSISFADKLIEKGCSNLYLLANTQLPGLEMEEDTKEWYRGIQKEWRTELLNRRLIETTVKGENNLLSESYIPEIVGIEKEDQAFWTLVGEFHGFNKIPKHDLNIKWFNAINGDSVSDYETWGKHLILKRDNFLKHVEEKLSTEEIEKIGSIPDAVAWLNKLYEYLSAVSAIDTLNHNKIVPNQYGNLELLKPLFKESESSKIPDLVLDVLNDLEQDWKKDMIHRQVLLPGIQHVERGLTNASEEINNHLKKEIREKGVVTYDFLKHKNAKEILISILRLATKDSKQTSFRSGLFDKCKDIYHITGDTVEVNNLEGFNFDNVTKLSVRMINETITQSVNLDGLSTVLNKDPDKTVIWLDSYLRFLSENKEHSYLLENGNIIPNRYGILSSFVSLHNYGTKEQALDTDLILILKQLNDKEDWNNILVGDGIGISVKNTETFAELGSSIMEAVAKIKQNNTYDDFRTPLITLIEWCAKHSKLASHYLADFDNRKNSLFYILTMENNAIGTEIIGLLKNQERFNLIIEISNSISDVGVLKELLDITSRVDKPDEILKFAQEYEEDQLDFKFKLELGKRIEDAFALALDAEGLKVDVKYHGIGSHDFEIKNPENGRKFFVELKSHSAANLMQPIRMSMSQVDLANTNPDNFALCVIPRPHQYNDVTVETIRENLKLVINYRDEFLNVFEDYKSFSSLTSKPGVISLEVFDRKCKLKIEHSFIEDNHESFSSLIGTIKTQLML